MLVKNGKFYADWRDSKGRRHRKSCNTRKEAKTLTAKMREAQNPSKKPRARRQQ
jgi:hypothetical protein